jgi:hypothetical protein
MQKLSPQSIPILHFNLYLLKPKTILLSLLILSCIIRSDAAVIESATSGEWFAGSTWVGEGVPLITDDVVIKNTHTVTLSTSQTYATLTIDAGGILDWSTGTLNGTGMVTNNGTINVITFSLHYTYSDITNNGTLNWTHGYLDYAGGHILTNTGTFYYNRQYCYMTVVNTGLVSKTVGLIAYLSVPFNNQSGGIFTMSAGTLFFEPGGILTNNGTFNNFATIKGTGSLVQNGTFSTNANSKIMPGASPGIFPVTGNLDFGSMNYQCEINGP